MAYDPKRWVTGGHDPFRRARWMPYLLGLLMLAFAFWGVSGVFDDGESGSGFPTSLFILLMVTPIGSPFVRNAWFLPGKDKVFDEFERDALLRATKHSYEVMVVLLTSLFGWLWLVTANGWPMPAASQDWVTLGFAVLGISVVLPIFFAEIMVPLQPEGETQED